jgi:alkylation response protein AidB-like acyl-CoA dehydrogenase
LGWSEADLLRGYIRLATACLTTAFVLSQRVAAVSRLLASKNEPLRRQLVPPLLTSGTFATVGISHLTTSRTHLSQPVLLATETAAGFTLTGYTPWVTGAAYADMLVIGAALQDGRQILAALDAHCAGVQVPPAEQLVALSSSQTGRIEFEHVALPSERILAGPVENVMRQGLSAGTGGLQTSALAIGLTRRALELLEQESQRRPELVAPSAAFRDECDQLEADLLRVASHDPVCTPDAVRQRANDLVLRTTQAALMASKGAGYVASHPAGRLCREALFFLVWSCPQHVTAAHLCDLAGLS